MGAYITLHKYDNKLYEFSPIKNKEKPASGQNKVRADIFSDSLAVGVRFELTIPFGITLFKSVGLNRSPTLPFGPSENQLASPSLTLGLELLDLRGIEPLTFSLQMRRSTTELQAQG